MDIKIVVATHKKNEMPASDLYLPVHVGKEGKEDVGYVGDNTGDNISIKNPNYSELTAIYWAWKNLDVDFIGLVHYRRYFAANKKKGKGFKNLLTKDEAEKLLSETDVILPKKRNYFIESLYSHYSNTHDERHLIETKNTIDEIFPDYSESFTRVLQRKKGHMFNMFIMKKEVMNSYCAWLFPILFDLETKIDYKNLSPYDARLFGRISELLLDVWIDKNSIKYKEIPCIHLGKIDWTRKIFSFIFAKFSKKKYSKSF